MKTSEIILPLKNVADTMQRLLSHHADKINAMIPDPHDRAGVMTHELCAGQAGGTHWRAVEMPDAAHQIADFSVSIQVPRSYPDLPGLLTGVASAIRENGGWLVVTAAHARGCPLLMLRAVWEKSLANNPA